MVYDQISCFQLIQRTVFIVSNHFYSILDFDLSSFIEQGFEIKLEYFYLSRHIAWGSGPRKHGTYSDLKIFYRPYFLVHQWHMITDKGYPHPKCILKLTKSTQLAKLHGQIKAWHKTLNSRLDAFNWERNFDKVWTCIHDLIPCLSNKTANPGKHQSSLSSLRCKVSWKYVLLSVLVST